MQILQVPSRSIKTSRWPHRVGLKAWRLMRSRPCASLSARFPARRETDSRELRRFLRNRIVIPNRTLDTQELNDLAEKNAKKKKFDAANAERKRVIDDETNKLLILATGSESQDRQPGERSANADDGARG